MGSPSTLFYPPTLLGSATFRAAAVAWQLAQLAAESRGGLAGCCQRPASPPPTRSCNAPAAGPAYVSYAINAAATTAGHAQSKSSRLMAAPLELLLCAQPDGRRAVCPWGPRLYSPFVLPECLACLRAELASAVSCGCQADEALLRGAIMAIMSAHAAQQLRCGSDSRGGEPPAPDPLPLRLPTAAAESIAGRLVLSDLLLLLCASASSIPELCAQLSAAAALEPASEPASGVHNEDECRTRHCVVAHVWAADGRKTSFKAKTRLTAACAAAAGLPPALRVGANRTQPDDELYFCAVVEDRSASAELLRPNNRRCYFGRRMLAASRWVRAFRRIMDVPNRPLLGGAPTRPPLALAMANMAWLSQAQQPESRAGAGGGGGGVVLDPFVGSGSILLAAAQLQAHQSGGGGTSGCCCANGSRGWSRPPLCATLIGVDNDITLLNGPSAALDPPAASTTDDAASSSKRVAHRWRQVVAGNFEQVGLPLPELLAADMLSAPLAQIPLSCLPPAFRRRGVVHDSDGECTRSCGSTGRPAAGMLQAIVSDPPFGFRYPPWRMGASATTRMAPTKEDDPAAREANSHAAINRRVCARLLMMGEQWLRAPTLRPISGKGGDGEGDGGRLVFLCPVRAGGGRSGAYAVLIEAAREAGLRVRGGDGGVDTVAGVDVADTRCQHGVMRARCGETGEEKGIDTDGVPPPLMLGSLLLEATVCQRFARFERHCVVLVKT
jgi:hypothetical protein